MKQFLLVMILIFVGPIPSVDAEGNRGQGQKALAHEEESSEHGVAPGKGILAFTTHTI